MTAHDSEAAWCEWCGQEAWYWVEAAWSVADFLQFDVCLDHLRYVCDLLEKRTVDGKHALVETHTYYPKEVKP